MIAYLTQNAMLPNLLKILLSCICGLVVGLERTRRLKEAGVRTHCIIAATAALLMIISKYGFTDLIFNGELTTGGTRGADAARIAAQVVSGVSFLCAGVIFKNGNSVRGLTTASGIWATAGIGLAIGSGMIPEGVALTVVIILIQVVFHHISIGTDVFSEVNVRVISLPSEEIRSFFFGKAESKELQIISYHVYRDKDDSEKIDVVFRPKNDITMRQTIEMFEKIPEILSVNVNS